MPFPPLMVLLLAITLPPMSCLSSAEAIDTQGRSLRPLLWALFGEKLLVDECHSHNLLVLLFTAIGVGSLVLERRACGSAPKAAVFVVVDRCLFCYWAFFSSWGSLFAISSQASYSRRFSMSKRYWVGGNQSVCAWRGSTIGT